MTKTCYEERCSNCDHLQRTIEHDNADALPSSGICGKCGRSQTLELFEVDTDDYTPLTGEPCVVVNKATDKQVGGGHYKNRAIQPVEYSERNNLSFLEGCIVKRITRWKEKDGIKDLRKIQHEVDLIIEIHNLKG
jgi:hypothetical protein